MHECKTNYQQRLQSEHDQAVERQSKEIERIKIQQEKVTNELNLELDRLRANGTWETSHSDLIALCVFRRCQESIDLHRKRIRTIERWLLRFESETEGTAQFVCVVGTGESDSPADHRRHQTRESPSRSSITRGNPRSERFQRSTERRTSFSRPASRRTSIGIPAESRLATDENHQLRERRQSIRRVPTETRNESSTDHSTARCEQDGSEINARDVEQQRNRVRSAETSSRAMREESASE